MLTIHKGGSGIRFRVLPHMGQWAVWDELRRYWIMSGFDTREYASEYAEKLNKWNGQNQEE